MLTPFSMEPSKPITETIFKLVSIISKISFKSKIDSLNTIKLIDKKYKWMFWRNSKITMRFISKRIYKIKS